MSSQNYLEDRKNEEEFEEIQRVRNFEEGQKDHLKSPKKFKKFGEPPNLF